MMILTEQSTAVLMTKIENIHNDIKEVKLHLERLNGQTSMNTGFRHRQEVINKILYAIGGLGLTLTGSLIWSLIIR